LCVGASLWFWAFTNYQIKQRQKPKSNVLQAGWHKNHDENKCRRVGVVSEQKGVGRRSWWNFANEGYVYKPGISFEKMFQFFLSNEIVTQ